MIISFLELSGVNLERVLNLSPKLSDPVISPYLFVCFLLSFLASSFQINQFPVNFAGIIKDMRSECVEISYSNSWRSHTQTYHMPTVLL